jgi:hypothetical protein
MGLRPSLIPAQLNKKDAHISEGGFSEIHRFFNSPKPQNGGYQNTHPDSTAPCQLVFLNALM